MFYHYAMQPAILDFITIIVDIHKNFSCQVKESAITKTESSMQTMLFMK